MKMPFLLISPKIVPKIQLIKKGGCFEYHAVIADKIKYRYVHRASICPALGMDRRSFFMPKPMGKYKRLEVFYLSKPVYTADKPSDCHYCYFWTNGRKGCRLGRNNCYYLISLPPKPKSECDGCPYGRDHPCIGWCTKKVMREVGLILMVDANLQRESILPSERAFAYKMKLDAIKHQGQRTDLTSSQVGMKLQAMDIVGQEAGESRNQVHRYIRLTELIPELLDMVDTGQIKFNPAVELSYLASEEQKDFLSAMDYAQAAPSLSQAQRIKKLAQEGECTLDAMCEIMNEIKKGELDRVTFKTDSLRKYFPKSYTNKQMEDKIIQLLEQWQKKREKSMER